MDELFQRRHDNAQFAAERALLRLADVIYGHGSLKPMSKTLFFLSRCLLIAETLPAVRATEDLVQAYHRFRAAVPALHLREDYAFAQLAYEARATLPLLIETIGTLRQVAVHGDALGLAFDTLLRGRYEGGEGFATFLTPEEIVVPMVRMALAVLDRSRIDPVAGLRAGVRFGDICGGTGRFVHALVLVLRGRGVALDLLERAALLFDQSATSVDFATINLWLDGLHPHFATVEDSVTAPETDALVGRCLLLATNPPFGVGKYRLDGSAFARFAPLLLQAIGSELRGGHAEPALVLLLRNLDLLCDGGVLAIVLPDGAIAGPAFLRLLGAYEQVRAVRLSLHAVVSLPPAAFALSGTAAKTSFLIVQKHDAARPRAPLRVVSATHIGFRKRGNRRVPDPAGNDLIRIADAFEVPPPAAMPDWTQHARLLDGALRRAPATGRTVGDVALLLSAVASGRADLHVSILDVDTTGLLDLAACASHTPTSLARVCAEGDVLVSCLNPKIWRVALVPVLGRSWSCSPEFAVLRCGSPAAAARLFFQLQLPTAMRHLQERASGTSSSRQRVRKRDVLAIPLDQIALSQTEIDAFLAQRAQWYAIRTSELALFARLRERG
jgi:hypothetical protein